MARDEAYKPDDASKPKPPRKSMANPAFEEDVYVKWAWRLLFYAIYYTILYFVFTIFIDQYRSNNEMDTRKSPVLQTRLDSANMRVFPNDYVREKDYFASDSANQLNFANTDKQWYRADSHSKCPMPIFGCPADWEKKSMREVFTNEFSARLGKIQEQIDAGKSDNGDPIVGSGTNANSTYSQAVTDFCGSDGMEYTNNQACFFVSLNLVNSWVPIGLDDDYQMAKNLQGGFADTTIENQLHGSHSNGSNVYFGCRLFGTKGASKSASQIIDYSKPKPLADSSKYISWMGGQNYIESSYYPKSNTDAQSLVELRKKHRHEQDPTWYRPELVMKVDMSDASESLAFECNAYANNIKTPMMVLKDGKAGWASRMKFPDRAHQSFVMIST